uniref:Uncharacterized protein n=1 Tax=Anguilla anguilla TaxID=7936 RepID=A0A0E9UQY2_ANGAN
MKTGKSNGESNPCSGYATHWKRERTTVKEAIASESGF